MSYYNSITQMFLGLNFVYLASIILWLCQVVLAGYVNNYELYPIPLIVWKTTKPMNII